MLFSKNVNNTEKKNKLLGPNLCLWKHGNIIKLIFVQNAKSFNDTVVFHIFLKIMNDFCCRVTLLVLYIKHSLRHNKFKIRYGI